MALSTKHSSWSHNAGCQSPCCLVSLPSLTNGGIEALTEMFVLLTDAFIKHLPRVYLFGARPRAGHCVCENEKNIISALKDFRGVETARSTGATDCGV